MSPTARTLQKLRADGYIASVVERWNPHARIRQDLFGIVDILAIKPGLVMGVQATSGSNHRARVVKSLAEANLKPWLESGAKFQVWSWAKRGARGQRKLWTPRIEAIEINQLTEVQE